LSTERFLVSIYQNCFCIRWGAHIALLRFPSWICGGKIGQRSRGEEIPREKGRESGEERGGRKGVARILHWGGAQKLSASGYAPGWKGRDP